MFPLVTPYPIPPKAFDKSQGRRKYSNIWFAPGLHKFGFEEEKLPSCTVEGVDPRLWMLSERQNFMFSADDNLRTLNLS